MGCREVGVGRELPWTPAGPWGWAQLGDPTTAQEGVLVVNPSREKWQWGWGVGPDAKGGSTR